MTRLVHKATDALSEAAQQVMISGFLGKKTYRAIVRDIREATGEKVAERTIARRGVEWRTEQSRLRTTREQVKALVAAMKSENLAASEIISALATDALLRDPEAFAAADPLAVQSRNLEAEKLRQKSRELDLKEEGARLAREKFVAATKKLEAIRAQATKAKDAVERLKGEGAALPAEVEKQILAMYGLSEAN